MLLLDSAHDHAEVFCFNDDAYPHGINGVLDRLGDLVGQSFLDLEPPGVHFHQAGDLAQANDLFAGR